MLFNFNGIVPIEIDGPSRNEIFSISEISERDIVPDEMDSMGIIISVPLKLSIQTDYYIIGSFVYKMLFNDVEWEIPNNIDYARNYKKYLQSKLNEHEIQTSSDNVDKLFDFFQKL